MREISVREFQLHASYYLENLPVVLTQYGKAVAMLVQMPEITSVNTRPISRALPELNEGMELLESLLGTSCLRFKLNRFALHRLIKKYTKERVFKAIQISFMVKGTPYAPVITNFLDLEQKWEKLEAFVMRKANGGYAFDATGGEDAS